MDKQKMGSGDSQRIKNEAELLKLLDHPHILKYKNVRPDFTRTAARL